MHTRTHGKLSGGPRVLTGMGLALRAYCSTVQGVLGCKMPSYSEPGAFTRDEHIQEAMV